MGLSEITKPCIYPLHLLKSLFLLPVPQVAQKSYFIAERCQNFKQALSLSPASPSSFPLIPGRLGRGRLLTLTCSSARIMLASLSILWGRRVKGNDGERGKGEVQGRGECSRQKREIGLRWVGGVCVCVCLCVCVKVGNVCESKLKKKRKEKWKILAEVETEGMDRQ